MKQVHDLIVRLLQETNHGGTKVLIRNRQGDLLPIMAVRQATVLVPQLQADIDGPLAHNEDILIIEADFAVRQQSLAVTP